MFLTEACERYRLSSLCAFHWHQELLLAGTRCMERQKTGSLAALNTGPFTDTTNRTFLRSWRQLELSVSTNDVTYQFPTLFRYFVETGDRLHKNLIGNARFGYPDCAKQVDPFSVYSLLECSAFVGTQNA